MEQVALNNEQSLYLQFIFDHFRQQNRWPSHRQLDQFFNRRYPDLDIEDIWNTLPRGLTSHLDIHQLDMQATLTIPGIYALEPHAPEFEMFIKVIQMCVETFFSSESHELSSDDILQRHPTWFQPGIARTGWLLLGESVVWQSFAGPNDAGWWRCTVARDIRRFRGTATIEDYMEKRNSLRPQTQPASALSFSPVSASTVSSVSIHAGMLHPDIATKCWNLYLQGEYDNAILNATKAIEVAIRNKAQLADTVVGVDVINTALSEQKPLLRYSSIKAEQQGMMSLLRGIIQVYKNPHSHRFVGTQDASECLGILLLCSSLLSMIDHIQKI